LATNAVPPMPRPTHPRNIRFGVLFGSPVFVVTLCSTFWPAGYDSNCGDRLRTDASGIYLCARRWSRRPALDRDPNQHHEHGADHERQHILEGVGQRWSPLSRCWQSNHRPPACLLDLRPIPAPRPPTRGAGPVRIDATVTSELNPELSAPTAALRSMRIERGYEGLPGRSACWRTKAKPISRRSTLTLPLRRGSRPSAAHDCAPCLRSMRISITASAPSAAKS
jgi:hypothetical protein